MPFTRISPAVGSYRRVRLFRKVVLPQPVGPTMHRNSPSSTSKFKLFQHQQVTELFGQLLHFYLRLFVCHCPAPPLQRMIYYRIDLAAQPQKFRIGVITGTRQVVSYSALTPVGRCAAPECGLRVHCLSMLIGYKNNGALFRLPDAGQLSCIR